MPTVRIPIPPGFPMATVVCTNLFCFWSFYIFLSCHSSVVVYLVSREWQLRWSQKISGSTCIPTHKQTNVQRNEYTNKWTNRKTSKKWSDKEFRTFLFGQKIIKCTKDWTINLFSRWHSTLSSKYTLVPFPWFLLVILRLKVDLNSRHVWYSGHGCMFVF